MKYMIRIDTQLHGYEDPRVLLIDLLTYKPWNYKIYKKDDTFLRVSYSQITDDELRSDSDAYEQALFATIEKGSPDENKDHNRV